MTIDRDADAAEVADRPVHGGGRDGRVARVADAHAGQPGLPHQPGIAACSDSSVSMPLLPSGSVENTT